MVPRKQHDEDKDEQPEDLLWHVDRRRRTVVIEEEHPREEHDEARERPDARAIPGVRRQQENVRPGGEQAELHRHCPHGAVPQPKADLGRSVEQERQVRAVRDPIQYPVTEHQRTHHEADAPLAIEPPAEECRQT